MESNIENLTIKQVREIAALADSLGISSTGAAVAFERGRVCCPFVPGSAYYIRTITYHLTGRVRELCGGFLVLDEAAWIADSGRYADAFVKGELSEVEPLPDGTLVALSAITDASPWRHTLPRTQK